MNSKIDFYIQKDYNEKIKQNSDIYTQYKNNLVEYFKQKLKKIMVKNTRDNETIEKIKDEIEILKYDMKYFNIENIVLKTAFCPNDSLLVILLKPASFTN